jgi:hypothetical protein
MIALAFIVALGIGIIAGAEDRPGFNEYAPLS